MPSRTAVSHLMADEQQLTVGQSATPDPAQASLEVGRAGGGQPQMLFEKPEQMLNGKAPQIHPRQVGQRHRSWASPEQIERTLEARRTIGFEKLNREDQAHQKGQLIEVKVCPGQQAHRLTQQGTGFDPVRGATWRRQFEFGAVLAWTAFLSRLTFRRFLIQHPVAADTHQGVDKLYRQEDGQKRGVAIQ